VTHLKSGQLELAHRELADAFAAATSGRDYNDICWQLAIDSEDSKQAFNILVCQNHRSPIAQLPI
jgi:hypothetical protein